MVDRIKLEDEAEKALWKRSLEALNEWVADNSEIDMSFERVVFDKGQNLTANTKREYYISPH